MRGKKRASAGFLLLALAATFFAHATVQQPDVKGGHASIQETNAATTVVKLSTGKDDQPDCHMGVAQDPGQNPGQPGQEEEGNPSHKRPEHSCSHKPDKQQVRCHCQTDCNPDGTQKEDKRCRSYCYKDKCTCPRRPCE
jgi:hypothetical protein